MASPNDVPRVSEPIAAAGGYVTRAWVDFFLKLASSQSNEDLAALYAALAQRVSDLEDGTGFDFQILGQGSIGVNGIPQPGGVVIITLLNDADSPGNTMYYGTGPTGTKGWFPVSGTMLIEEGQLTKTVGSNGVTTFGLAPLADTGVGTFKAITRDPYGRVEGSRNGTADDVPVAKLGAATYDTLQESINVLNSPGLISGGVLSDGGGGNVAWTAGTISIRATDSDVATLYMANFAAGTAAIPNDSMTRFLGVSYNAGTPIVIVKTSDTWDYDTEFPIGEVANLGGTLFPFSNPFKIGDPITNIIQRFDAQAYSIRAASGGLLMSTNGTTRNLDLTAGIIWARLNDFSIAARTSTTFPMYSVRPSGVTPPLIFTPGFTQWPNTQFVSGTTLTTMTNNRWANLWVFVNIGTGAWGFAYGTAEYNNSSGASAEQVPAYLTQNFLRQNLLLGRILFEKNSTAPIIESAFTRVFSTQAVSDHNQLSGLQGGTVGQYYHSTAAQNAALAAISVSGYINGLRMVWNSGTSVSFDSGTATIQSTGTIMTFPSAITKAGLALAVSTFYHCYAYSNAGTPDIEIVTTAPAAPYNGTARSKTGDASRRYIGSLLTDASGNVRRFVQSDTEVSYLDTLGVVPYRILAAGAATTPTAVSVLPAAPITAAQFKGQLINNVATGFFVISAPGGMLEIISVAPNTRVVQYLPIFNSQMFYYNTMAGGSSFIDLHAYVFER